MLWEWPANALTLRRGKPRTLFPAGLRRLHERDQLVAVMFELLVADAGDATELRECRRTRRRDAVDRGVVQHDIGRHTALARHFRTPGPERGEQGGIAGFNAAGGCGSNVAAP